MTTHSPVFVCKNIFDLTCLIRLQKKSAVSVAYQLRKEDIDNLFNDNISLFSRFSIMLNNPSVSQTIKEKKSEEEIWVNKTPMKRRNWKKNH